MSCSLKKWTFDSGRRTKHNIDFQSPQAVLILEKYDQQSNRWLSGKN